MANENREEMRGVKRFLEYQPVVRKSQRVEKRSNDKKRKVEEKSLPGQRLMKSRRLTASPSHPPTSPPLNHPNPPPPSPSPKSSHSAHSIIHPSVEPSHISLKTSVNPSGPDVQRVKRPRTQPDSAHPTSYQVPATPLVVRRARRRLASRSTPPTTTQDTTPDPSTTSRLSPADGLPILIPRRKRRKIDSLVRSQPGHPSNLPLPQTSSPTNNSHVCSSCRNRFLSYEALEYHQNLKIRGLKKQKIPVSRFTPELHLSICPIKGCCSSFAKVEEMREHIVERHRKAGKQYLHGAENSLNEIYVILKHSPTEEGIISCPACQTNFNNRSNLKRHQNNHCRGYGQFNCVICAAHFRDRRQMLNHMRSAHPPPTGIRITGMFKGKQKERKGVRTERSTGGRELLTQYTFIPDRPVVTSAGEFFTDAITEGVTWLIQRARSSGGDSILRLNISSLIRRGESRSLLPFNTQARMLSFSTSDSPKSIIIRWEKT